MKRFVIIVAGGSGLRMGTDVPKQFIQINNKSILEYTVDAFLNAYSDINIIVVLPQKHIDTWLQIYKNKNLGFKQTVVIGGNTRFNSVKNGIAAINCPDALVAIHDGVRPLVNTQTIKACFDKAKTDGAAIPVISVKDSLRLLKGNFSESINRDNFRIVQTPQCFHYQILEKSYDVLFREDFTDDASVVESAGFKISLVEGNDDNIKITTKTDLSIAELLLLKNK